MPVSEKQRAANQRNAQQSTGPKTEEGKARASQNARVHGLTAFLPEVGPEAEQARVERLASCIAQFRPQTGWQCWLVEDLADVTLKLGRIGTIERQLRAVAAARADSDQWDEDRRLEAEVLGARLGREPSRVVAQLRQSPHGCDWLIERWAVLARIADTTDSGWNEEQTNQAHDLMGTPATARSGSIGCQIDTDGQVIRADLAPAALAREQIVELQAIRDRVAEIDVATRATIAAGWSDLPSRDAVTLRRYESTTRRRLTWIMTQLKLAGIDIMGQTAPRVASQATPTVPTSPQTQPQPLEVPAERPARNEPNSRDVADETKPLAAIWITDPTSKPTQRRPDPAKIAQRERKARRKRSRTQR